MVLNTRICKSICHVFDHNRNNITGCDVCLCCLGRRVFLVYLRLYNMLYVFSCSPFSVSVTNMYKIQSITFENPKFSLLIYKWFSNEQSCKNSEYLLFEVCLYAYYTTWIHCTASWRRSYAGRYEGYKGERVGFEKCPR